MANVYMRADYGDSKDVAKAGVQTEPYIIIFLVGQKGLPDTTCI